MQPVAQGWIILLIIAVLVAALVIGPDASKLTLKQRRTLLFIRLALVGLVVLAMLRPGIVSTISQRQSAVLGVMLDYSRSMKLSHLAVGPNRWEAMNELLEENRDRFQALKDQNIDVRFYSYGNRLKPINDLNNGLPALPEQPSEGESDAGTAIFEVIDSVRDQRLLGLVMMGWMDFPPIPKTCLMPPKWSSGHLTCSEWYQDSKQNLSGLEAIFRN